MVHWTLNLEVLLGKLTMLIITESKSSYLCMQLETTYKVQFNVHAYHYHLNFIDAFQKDKILAHGIQ